MSGPSFPKIKRGQWVQPIRRGYLMACCDCALVHRVEWRIVSNKSGTQQSMQWRMERAPGHTKALRKKQGITVR